MQEGRQLLAVMFTDIVGYTSLTAADEKHSLNLVETVNHKLKSCIESYHGEWVQQVGDGTLSTFVSAHDALTCAVAIQQEFLAKPIVELRIGIHIGDIVVKLPNVWGSGVNVASRIESFAQKGEIVVSQLVKDALSCHPEFAFDARGAHSFKGVPEPIAVFAIDAATTQITRPYDFPAESQKSASTPNISATALPISSLPLNASAQGFAKYKTYALLSVVLVALIVAAVSTSLFDSTRLTISFKTAGINFDSASNTPEKQFIKSLSRHLSKATSAHVERTGGAAAPRISITPDDGSVTISHADEKRVYGDVNTAFANLDQVATLIINAQDWLTDSEKHNLALYLDALKTLDDASTSNEIQNMLEKVTYLQTLSPSKVAYKALECRALIKQQIILQAPLNEFRQATSSSCQSLQDAKDENAKLALAEYYRNLGEYQFASVFLKQIPQNTFDGALARGDQAFLQGDVNEAKRILEAANQELLIANTLVTLDLGLYQLALGNLEESKRIFKQVLANDPKSFLAKRRLATTLVLLGEFEASNTYFTEINVTNPTIQTLTNQGTALYYLGRFEDAAKVFKRAIELSQNDYLVFGNYADALYEVSGLTTETKKQYLTAIDIALTNLANGTKDPFMALDLAHYHSQLGEYEQADDYFKQFEKNNSRSGDYYYYKAISFARRSDHKNVTIYIEKSMNEGFQDVYISNTPAFKQYNLKGS